jgi:hypothetical protein
MLPDEVQIRLDLCGDCPVQCPEFRAGGIDHQNPCASCPIRKWAAFEEPGCPKTEPPPMGSPFAPAGPPKFTTTPGGFLKWCIWKITGQIPGNCQCNQRAKQMNAWGWSGCWKNRSTVLAWLAHEAAARGHVIGRAKLWSLFLAGYREFRRRKV